MNDRHRQMIKLLYKKYNKNSELLKNLEEATNDLKISKIKCKLRYINYVILLKKIASDTNDV